MRIGLGKYWERLRTSFWFVPMLLTTGAVVLAYLNVRLDKVLADQWRSVGFAFLHTASPEGATAILGAVASSMITIAGVVFSMTLVVLSLASSQFGPRIIRTFMADRMNQTVLGTFVATFLYSLVVLRLIRYGAGELFIPHLSITVAVLLAIVSLAFLIYFIHHVAVSIQADDIVARVGEELLEGIDRLFPEPIGGEADTGAALPAEFDDEARPIRASDDGYLQLVDGNRLVELACDRDLVVSIEARPGRFVVMGEALARAWPSDRLDDRALERAEGAFVIGSNRTPLQDVEFSVNQLVEIALRALSPAYNDTFTATACVDRLGAGLVRLAQRQSPAPWRRDHDGSLRVVAPTTTFPEILDAAIDKIRQSARANVAVALRLLEVIQSSAGVAERPDDRAALRRQAEMIARGAREAVPERRDRDLVEARWGQVVSLLT